MLNINSINFKNNFKAFRPNSLRAQNTIIPNYSTKLAPLAKDTISFKGVFEYKTALNNGVVCQELHDNAKEVKEYFYNLLRGVFVQKDEKNNPQKDQNGDYIYIEGIKTVKGRIKTPDSIQEKIADKIEEAFDADAEEFQRKIFLPKETTSVKSKVTDIVGARIVMSDVDATGIASDILKRLAEVIIREKLIVDEIENHCLENENDKSNYFNQEDLREFAKVVNEVRKAHGLKPIKVENRAMDSGYIALHLDFDLEDIGEMRKNKGYHAELQILGSDIEMLKDVEDYCYKLKKGKSIKSGDVTYRPFAEIFNQCFKAEDGSTDNALIKEFNKYTKFAYRYQRERKPEPEMTADGTRRRVYVYPTIEQFYENEAANKRTKPKKKLPTILDFNILARIYRDCEDLYNTKHNPAKVLKKTIAEAEKETQEAK